MAKVISCVFRAVFSASAASAQGVVDQSGADIPPDTVARMISEVTRDMRDPLSAQFRELRWSPRDATVPEEGVAKTICGSINAKNAMGGYVGFTVFAWNAALPGRIDFEAKGEKNKVLADASLTWLSLRGCPVAASSP